MTAILGIVKVQCCLFVRHVRDYCWRLASVLVSLVIQPRSSDFVMYRKCAPERGHLMITVLVPGVQIKSGIHFRCKGFKRKTLCMYIHTRTCTCFTMATL